MSVYNWQQAVCPEMKGPGVKTKGKTWQPGLECRFEELDEIEVLILY